MATEDALGETIGETSFDDGSHCAVVVAKGTISLVLGDEVTNLSESDAEWLSNRLQLAQTYAAMARRKR